MISVADLCTAAAAKWPHRVVLRFDEDGEVLTFKDLDERSTALAQYLYAAGIKQGDRVVVICGNRAIFPVSWMAILKVGAVMSPINTASRTEDARHLVTLADPAAVICDLDKLPLLNDAALGPAGLRVIITASGSTSGTVSFQEALELGAALQAPPRPEGDISNIQFTSGTSGLPKGCVLPHAFWLELAQSVAESVIDLAADDVILTAQAFSYMDPQWALVLALRSGAELVVLDRFRPSVFWEKIDRYRVSFFYCLAAMPLMLLSVPVTPHEKSHRLKVVMCSAIPAARQVEMEERYGVPWLEAYGSTEAGSLIGVTRDEHAQTRSSGTIGRPLKGREAKLVDHSGRPLGDDRTGELLVRGPGMMQGYWRDPQATNAAFTDGWFRTGDLAVRDDAGRYYLVGRVKDVIRRAGENIAAQEIETVLQSHPAITLAACIAVPDPIRNEEVKAVLVLSEAISVAELAAFLSERVARFKVPRYWEFVLSLPMTPSQRVEKSKLSRSTAPPVLDYLR